MEKEKRKEKAKREKTYLGRQPQFGPPGHFFSSSARPNLAIPASTSRHGTSASARARHLCCVSLTGVWRARIASRSLRPVAAVWDLLLYARAVSASGAHASYSALPSQPPHATDSVEIGRRADRPQLGGAISRVPSTPLSHRPSPRRHPHEGREVAATCHFRPAISSTSGKALRASMIDRGSTSETHLRSGQSCIVGISHRCGPLLRHPPHTVGEGTASSAPVTIFPIAFIIVRATNISLRIRFRTSGRGPVDGCLTGVAPPRGVSRERRREILFRLWGPAGLGEPPSGVDPCVNDSD